VIKKRFEKSGILKGFKGDIKFNEPLSLHTSFKIGGPCDAWVSPVDAEELKGILDFCRNNDIDNFVIGRGCNLLISDEGYRGVVISLDKKEFNYVRFANDEVCAGSGTCVGRLLELVTEAGFAGLEFLAGIPATVGGAVLVNAGGSFDRIGNFVQQVKVMDARGNIRFIDKEKLEFGYRSSNLTDLIVLEVRFLLQRDIEDRIAKRRKHFLQEKKISQELAAPSAGCIFKNPEDHNESAGSLIESSGLKGKRIGNAQVSGVHSNFIINLGNATASDVLHLIELIQGKVKQDHGILLKPEVKIV